MFEQQESEIEQMLKQEIREQKRTGNGIHGRALRLRKHESVRTPSESLKGIERLKIYAPSVIYSTTIGEMKMNELLEKIKSGEIPPKQEFEVLEFESSQKALAELRRLHTNFAIMKSWKCSSNNLSLFFQKMQVARTKKGNSILIGQAAVDYFNKNKVSEVREEKVKRPYNRHVNVSQVSQSNDSDESNVNYKDVKEICDKSVTSTTIIEPINVIEVNNALININRIFKTEQISGLLDRLAMFLSEDDQEFLVELKVTEVVKGK